MKPVRLPLSKNQNTTFCSEIRQKADDPGYNIHLGKRSEINVGGTYMAGTVHFGSALISTKENLTVEAIDNQRKQRSWIKRGHFCKPKSYCSG